MSHNKKRNSGLIYETLVRELTKSIIVEKNEKKQQEIKNLIKRYFNTEKPLGRELQLYKALQEKISSESADRFLQAVKVEHGNIDKVELEKEQSRLINEVNRTLGTTVFDNHIPNYKNLATIAQIFSSKTPIKEKVILETKILSDLTKKEEKIEETKIDNVVYRSFVKRFNETYADSLLKEQKELLSHFISSANDDGLSLNMYLYEEIDRLKEKTAKLFQNEDFKTTETLSENAKRITQYLNDFGKQQINEETLKKVMKIQELVKEVQ
jgi:hypothetical protein